MKQTGRIGIRWYGVLWSVMVAISVFLCVKDLPAAPASPKKITNATLANAHEPGSIIYRTHEEFARRVKEKTNGEIIIKVVGAGQLGTGRAAMEAVQAGTLEFTHNPNSNLSPYEQTRFLFDLPFIFRDLEHMGKVMDGPIGVESVALVEKKLGLTIVMEGIFEGPRVTYNRVRPIVTPKDFQGLKIRVMENPINVATFRALGANPVPMAYTELYLALQQGTIDGAENAQVNILSAKHHEVTKFISRTNHLNAPIQVYTNTKWLNNLSAENRKAIMEAGREAVMWERQQYVEAVKKAEEQLVKEGCKINSPDLGPFREAVTSVWKEYEGRIGGWERV